MIQNTSGSTIKSWSSQVQVPVSAVPSQKPSVQPLWSATSHLVRNIAFDLGPKNIRVNGIAPGATRTDALKSVLNDNIEKKMLEHTPIQRLGEPQDMANVALFLCSPAAGWVSGQILTVSGGGVQELD